MVVFDRLMARLLIVAPDRWVLKGALALDLRTASAFRSTKDMDLFRPGGEQIATDDFIAVQDLDVDDNFVFAIERTDKLDAALEGASVRYHVIASLAGRRFEEVTVDVGFADPLVLPAEKVMGSELLDFAGFDSIEVPVLSLEQHVAEKLHAYSRMYSGQRSSSRVKDLIDLVVIRSMREFEANKLRHALAATFAARATHPLPSAVPSPPPDWRRPYRTLAIETKLDPDLSHGYVLTQTFLDPVLDRAVADDAHWNVTEGLWIDR